MDLYRSRYSDWLPAGQSRGRSSNPGRGKIFLHVFQTGSGAHPASHPIEHSSTVLQIHYYCIIIFIFIFVRNLYLNTDCKLNLWDISSNFYPRLIGNCWFTNSVSHLISGIFTIYLSTEFIYCSYCHVIKEAIDGVWIRNWIYWTLKDRNCKSL
jgi:hypothetical protein